MTKTLTLHENNSTFTSKAQTSRESASSFQNLQTSDSVLALLPLSSEFYLLNPLYAQSLNLLDSLLRVMEKQKLLRGSRSLA